MKMLHTSFWCRWQMPLMRQRQRAKVRRRGVRVVRLFWGAMPLLCMGQVRPLLSSAINPG